MDGSGRDSDGGGSEFRRGLDGVLGALRFLLDTDLDDEQRAIANRACHRAASLVEMLDADPSLAARSEKRDAALEDRPLDVLIVEDNDINARIVSRVLSKLGARYRRAENGRAALASVDLRMPDLVLMDIKMPIMDGYEATKVLRQSYGDALPIVALTSNAENDDREACFAAGMDQFLAKPFSTEELAAILEWVNGRRADMATRAAM